MNIISIRDKRSNKNIYSLKEILSSLNKIIIMLKKIRRISDSSITLQEARKNGQGLPLHLELLKFLIVLVMFVILVLSVQYSIDTVFHPHNYDRYKIMSLSVNIIYLFLFLIAMSKLEKRNLRSMGFADNIIPSYIKGFLVGSLMIIIVMVLGLLLGQYEIISINLSSAYLAVPFLLAFMIQSMEEEILSRGWMLVSISRKNSVVMAIFVTSIVFLLLHLGNNSLDIIAVINVFLFSVLLSVIFFRVDNIWFCGALHAAWNYIQGYLMGFNVSGQEEITSLINFNQVHYSILGGNNFGPESGLIVTVVLVVMLCIFLFVYEEG